MNNPTWFQVARRPKWIAGLFLALAIAAIFALLGQWQLDRSFTQIDEPNQNEEIFSLIELELPGAPITAAAANKLVSAEIYLDQANVYIVSGRLQKTNQETVSGYWVVANSYALLADGDSTASLTVALGFTKDLVTAEKARAELKDSIQVEAFLPREGRYLQTEAPVRLPDVSRSYLFGSLSLAQLVNLYSQEPIESFAGFLALSESAGFGLDSIVIAPPQPGLSVNWLTLFYAVEWALFAGFAVFLWWRLVEDQRIREQKVTKG
jgi:hypothetical protein